MLVPRLPSPGRRSRGKCFCQFPTCNCLDGLDRSIERLDAFKATLTYLSLTTEVMLRAAALWAEARRRGLPTADAKELDGDVILAAQAEAAGATIITESVGHLSRFVAVRSWRDE